MRGGWTCHVEQGNYGHESPKPTWLYYVGTNPPSMKWGLSGALGRHEQMGGGRNPHKRERTPKQFRDLLLSMARSVKIKELAEEKMKARIKQGAKVFMDHAMWVWPDLPHGDAEIVFDVDVTRPVRLGWLECKAHHFGIHDSYGNGSLFVKEQDLVGETEK